VVLALLLIALVLMWRKGVFAKLTPNWFKKNRYFKQSRLYIQVARSYIGSTRLYIYGVATAVATLVIAFWPEQTPQSMLRVVLLTISFISLVAIIAPTRRKNSHVS